MVDFDARQNLFDVTASILHGDKPDQELLDEANLALERIKDLRMNEKLEKLLGALSLIHCTAGGYDKSILRVAALITDDYSKEILAADDFIHDALFGITEGLEPKGDGPHCWCQGHCKLWQKKLFDSK